jgi:hypothetical protein
VREGAFRIVLSLKCVGEQGKKDQCKQISIAIYSGDCQQFSRTSSILSSSRHLPIPISNRLRHNPSPSPRRSSNPLRQWLCSLWSMYPMPSVAMFHGHIDINPRNLSTRRRKPRTSPLTSFFILLRILLLSGVGRHFDGRRDHFLCYTDGLFADPPGFPLPQLDEDIEDEALAILRWHLVVPLAQDTFLGLFDP